MQWNEYTGSMSIDELELLTRKGFVGKIGWIFEVAILLSGHRRRVHWNTRPG